MSIIEPTNILCISPFSWALAWYFTKSFPSVLIYFVDLLLIQLDEVEGEKTRRD